MKKSGKGLVMSIIASVLSVISFISLAFTFIAIIGTSRLGTEVENGGLRDYFNAFVNAEHAIEGQVFHKIAFALLVILLVVMLVVLVLSILQLFVDNKIVKLVLKYTCIAGMVLAVAFILFMAIGCIVNANNLNKGEVLGYKVTVTPHVGPILLSVCALASSILGFLSVGKVKAK